ncbi:MAG: pseudaminic acid synthase [Acidobacteriota bacterium]
MEPTFLIAGRPVGGGAPCWVVAELSANHRRDLQRAVSLVRAAAEAGADAVKTQTYRPETMTLPLREGPFLHHAPDSPWRGRSLWELYEEGALPWEWQAEMKRVAEDLGLAFLSSAYDRNAVDFLDRLDVPAIKIASFELVDLPLIEYAASTGRPLILSTGMATLAEIGEAVDAVRSGGGRRVVLLKCTSRYPTRAEEVNLRGMVRLAEEFGVPVGFSDHTTGIDAAAAAAAAGAALIEKHFTLREGGATLDDAFSLGPEEFRELVGAVRRVEVLLGSPELEPVPGEGESLGFRRSLYAVRDIARGEPFTPENVRALRPAGGLAPKYWNRIRGRTAARDLRRGEPLTWEAVAEDGETSCGE